MRNIVIGLVVFTVLLAATMIVAIATRPRSSISPKKHQQLQEMVDEAARIMRSLQFPDSVNMLDSTILGTEHKTEIANWINKHRNLTVDKRI